MNHAIHPVIANTAIAEFKKVITTIGTNGATKHDLFKAIIANDSNSDFTEEFIRMINPSYCEYIDDICDELFKSGFIMIKSKHCGLLVKGLNVLDMIQAGKTITLSTFA